MHNIRSNFLSIMTSLWGEHESVKFSPNELLLVNYLLYKIAGLQNGETIKLSTSTICAVLQFTRPTLKRCRESLAERGIIRFSPGNGKTSAVYEIVAEHFIAPDKPSSGVAAYCARKSVDPPARSAPPLTLDRLEMTLQTDTGWQTTVKEVVKRQDSVEIDDLRPHITNFFMTLKARGVEAKDIKDCKSYFLNWLRKNLNNNKKTNDYDPKHTLNRRRPTPVPTEEEPDYDSDF